MEIRPIKTEEDYKGALAQIEPLMDAAPGLSGVWYTHSVLNAVVQEEISWRGPFRSDRILT